MKMKQIRISVLAILMLAVTSVSAQNGKSKTPVMKTELDTVSKALGISVGKNLISAGIDSLSFEQFMEGIRRAYENKVTPTEIQEAQQTVDVYVQGIQERQAKAASKVGTDFLAANAKKEGVITLPSGLQYKVIKQGTGVKAVDGDQVTTHYTGTFIDGRIFDSSVQRGEPATFGVNQVIKGWTEALKLMPEGSKWQLFIPYTLAYGTQDRGSIPAYSTLIFEIELIDVVGK